MKKKQFLTVYTVSFTEHDPHTGLDRLTIGSYVRRGDAIRACAQYVIEKLERYSNMRHMLISDRYENVRGLLVDAGFDEDEIADLFFNDGSIAHFPKKMKNVLMRYLVDVIGGDAYYEIGSSVQNLVYRFDVDENDVESPEGLTLWTCITSGRDNENHDPDFENAFPETFLSEQDAHQCAIDDLKQYLDGYSRKEKDKILEDARVLLDSDGHFEFSLNDQVTRIWDVWRNPIDLGQGVKDGKQKRAHEESEESGA